MQIADQINKENSNVIKKENQSQNNINNSQSNKKSNNQNKIYTNIQSNDVIYKVIIIGSGPAGLTAGIYAARADLNPLILAGKQFGGQLMQTSLVENYPGFPKGVMGPELMDKMIKQAKRFGAEIFFKDVIKVEFDQKSIKPIHKVITHDNEYKSHAVIIATGAKPRKLGIKGEDEFWGKGVSSCATCDGAFYRDRVVAVVGGGDSAMEEADFLTKFAKKVYVIHRRKELRASKIMQKRAKKNSKIEFLFDTIVIEILGKEKVDSIKIKNSKTEKKDILKIDGFFLAIGYIPETLIFKDLIDIDKNGYARSAPNKRTMTRINGVFIAGDIEDDVYRQAVTAAGDGCKAALDAENWLSHIS